MRLDYRLDDALCAGEHETEQRPMLCALVRAFGHVFESMLNLVPRRHLQELVGSVPVGAREEQPECETEPVATERSPARPHWTRVHQFFNGVLLLLLLLLLLHSLGFLLHQQNVIHEIFKLSI